MISAAFLVLVLVFLGGGCKLHLGGAGALQSCVPDAVSVQCVAKVAIRALSYGSIHPCG